MDEADAGSEHLLDVASHGALEGGPAAHDRAVVGIDPELVERLVIREALRHVSPGLGIPVPGGQDRGEPRPDRRVDVARQERVLPGVPALGRPLDHDRARLGVDQQHVRDRPGRQRAGQPQSFTFRQHPLALRQPLLLDPEARQGLLHDHVEAPAPDREDDVRDAASELCDLGARLRALHRQTVRGEEGEHGLLVEEVGQGQAMWISTSSATPPSIV